MKGSATIENSTAVAPLWDDRKLRARRRSPRDRESDPIPTPARRARETLPRSGVDVLEEGG
jgi:hypothetical protein